MTLTALQTSIDTNLTPASAADRITAAELRTVMEDFKDELLDRGITIVANTTALAALSGANFKAAIVESNGVFKWLNSGTANGTTIFAASGGGTWNRILSVSGGGGASAIDDLTDVAITTPSNGQVLKFNGTAWVNDNEEAAGASALNDLTDVAITSASEGDTLEHNGTSFVNVNKGFTELTTTTWDGSNKYKTSLSGNLALTLNSSRAFGVLAIEDNNSHTLSINGTSVPINATTATLIGFVKANGVYYITDKDGLTIAVAGADVTAPTVSSATATDANTIRLVFNESMGAVTTAGHSFKQNGSTINPDSVSGSGTTWDFVFSETMISTDTLLRSYNSSTGATTDAAGNELASYTDQSVTNSIPAGSGETDGTYTLSGGFSKSGTQYTSAGGGWGDVAVDSKAFTGAFRFIVDMPDITHQPMLGVDDATTLNTYSNWNYFIYLMGTTYRIGYNGNGGHATTAFNVENGDRVSLHRDEAGVMTYEIFRGGSWSIIYEWATPISGTVYTKFSAGATGNIIHNPKWIEL